MIYLRQNTASQEIPLGYFLDSTNGDTEETGLTIANTDIKIWKAGATTLANKNSGGATHISNGVYYAILDATDSNTLGSLVIFIHVAGALTVRLECVVLNAKVYDSLITASDKLEVDLIQIVGDTQSATDLKDFADAGYDPATNKVQGVVLTDTCTTNTDMVGTDSAALATVCTEARLAELDAANIPADIDDIPTVAEFEARTLVAADYVITSDTIAGVNNVNSEVDLGSIKGTALTESNAGDVANNISQFYDVNPTTTSTVDDVGGGSGGDATAAKQAEIIDYNKALMSKDYTLINAVGSYDPADDANEAIRIRGDAAWGSGTSSGSNTITLTIEDQDTNPIIGVDVQIWNEAVSAFVTKNDTDSNGEMAFTEDDNTYKVKLKKAGYTFNALETLVVSGNTAETYSGTTDTIAPPISGDVCRIYENCKTQAEIFPTNVVGTAEIINLPFDANTALHVGDVVSGTYDDTTGVIYWDITRGATVQVLIESIGVSSNLVVPDQATARITDI
jgi:hypothetical protein